MVYYEYDGETFEFKGITKALLDPVEYIECKPKNTTTTEPPTKVLNGKLENEACLYDESCDNWFIIADYRGEWLDIDNDNSVEVINHLYDTSEGEDYKDRENKLKERLPYLYDSKTLILTLRSGKRLVRDYPIKQVENTGLPIKFFKFVDRGWEIDFDKIIGGENGEGNSLISSLSMAYRSKCERQYTYKKNDYQVDEASLQTMRNYLSLLEGTDKKISWVTADNVNVELKANDLKAIINSVLERNEKLFEKKQSIKKALREAKDLVAIEKICPNYLEILNDTQGQSNFEF